jgi:HEAT repeat protein
VRQAALWALGQLGERAPIEALTQALEDSDSGVRRAALWALGRLGERAPIEPLTQAAGDSWSYVRQAAVEALGRLGERAPIEALTQAARDSESDVRRAAIEALGRLGERAPIESLTQATRQREARVRDRALAVLVRTHPEALGPVADEALSVIRGEAPGPILSTIGRSATAELLSTRNGIGRTAEGSTFGPIEDTAGAVSSSPRVIGSNTILRLLGSYLHDEFWEVRMTAVLALRNYLRQVPDDMSADLYKLRHDGESRGVRETADDTLIAILSNDGGIEED